MEKRARGSPGGTMRGGGAGTLTIRNQPRVTASRLLALEKINTGATYAANNHPDSRGKGTQERPLTRQRNLEGTRFGEPL